MSRGKSRQQKENERFLDDSTGADGRVFIPQQPVGLPAGYKVTVSLASNSATLENHLNGKTALQKLAEAAKTFPPDNDLPADCASQIDHYLYGSPNGT